jgi:hypothetical protein
MLVPVLEMIGMAALLAVVFVLGWRMGLRERARRIEAALVYSKKMPYKAQGLYQTKALPIEKFPIVRLDVMQEGVIALHNSWRQKWHGQA